MSAQAQEVDGNFRKVTLEYNRQSDPQLAPTLKEPMALSVASDGRVFFIERAGAVKVINSPGTPSKLVGTLDVFTQEEDGLLGIALDPNFSKNGWIYLHYAHPACGRSKYDQRNGTNVVSRFVFSKGLVDLKSEKRVLEYERQREMCYHAAGSLAFDKEGNLYVATGDNTDPNNSQGLSPLAEDDLTGNAQKSSSNANDLRGKILRIHPERDGTYTIPRGNLFAAGTTGTRPEIYAMGCRNPFSLTVDQKSGCVYWGDIGPDATEGTKCRGPAGFDEINQACAAGNFGWPQFVADNKPYFDPDKDCVAFDPLKPVNRSKCNTGVAALPVAQPAFIFYAGSPSIKFPALGSGGRTAMAGPVYHFDPKLKSSHKLPKEFDHTLFVYDWSRQLVVAVHLDKSEKIERMERFCPNMKFKRPLDLELGPDGCLYMIEWGSAYENNTDSEIVRIEWVN